jgi:hypothetical protein
MQQANLAEHSTVETRGMTLPGAAPVNAFVINLCSSTSPVALTPPDHAGLKRFSFFVSRRREESRERFRLHMGYFDTQEEAEKLLDIVREIYPGAWAGLAPGQKLRAAAAQNVAPAAPAVATEVAPAQLDAPLDSTPAAAVVQAPAATAAAIAPAALPVAQSVEHEISPAPTAAAVAADAAPSSVAAPDAATDTTVVAAVPQDATTLVAAAALALLPDKGRHLPDSNLLKPENAAAARSLHDVRAAIAALEDTSERAPTLNPIPELKPAVHASGRQAVTPAEISDHGVLAVLEQGSVASTATTGSTVAMPMPMAGTSGEQAWRSAAPEEEAQADAQPRVEKPFFAVQLMWSVQPMDIAQVPQLAIFSAYTLYGAEGNRDGRRWYGLRLGFFTDAVSAKQVAHYVRSEFSTVSVVPVTARERERAKLAAGRPSATAVATARTPAATPSKPEASATPAAPPKTEFQFIEDKEQASFPLAKPGSASRPSKGAPGKRAKLRTQSAVSGRPRTKPMTLEETLEILGAGELKMDDGRQPLIDQSVEAHARAKPAKNKASRLGKLFERLSERMGS